MTALISGADRLINRMLYDASLDKDSLSQKKINWIASVAVTTMTLSLTIAYHIVFPQLRILIFYGFFTSLVFLLGVIFPLIIRRPGIYILFINQTLVATATFIAILKLGGIPTSGGLVMVGLALIFFSLNFRRRKHSIWIYIIYVISTITEGILQPRLTVPPEMTQEVNISLYVVNCVWISSFAMVFVMTFISQRVKLEQMETNRIREIDETRKRLYTNITHEFRTPLTVICGMNELMRKEPERWLAEGNESIDRNSKILLTLVNQMLDLSKIESGAMPINLIRSDINLYIKHIVELFQSLAAMAKISLIYSPCSPSPDIDYDPEKLMHIVSNLVSNALKFTPQAGRVVVSTSFTDRRYFEIQVSDNGPGIPEEFLPHVFDRFSKAEKGTVFNNPGSGLGLALTKELVSLLGGTIRVESIFGSGAEFVVTLPVSETAPLQDGPGLHEIRGRISHFIQSYKERVTGTKPSDDCRNEKPLVLIVEDNNDVVHLLTTILTKDYDVIVAENGDDGMTKAVDYIPDIILTDIMMPVVDGIEMLARVKTNPMTSHIPVVILTARADIASRLEGLEKGADAYMAKPFDSVELQVQIRSLILLRKRLQERYAAIGHLDMDEDKNFHNEDVFMKRVREIMIGDLGNEDLDIRFICEKMTISRTQLYRKFRTLTNRTITEYLRTLRLHRAKELLAGNNITVVEAAYRTGFRNVSHFSRVFKYEFGINPSVISRL